LKKVKGGGLTVYFYQRLRDLREDKDLTQEAVAKLLGTAREQYNKYELGKQEIPFHHVITLARFYNVSIDYISGIKDVPEKLFNK
jgi:transcriptional regulator with XRE-family HTH domain